MATLRIAALDGATKVFLTSLGGTTGTPAVGGYDLTQVVGLIHDATITGLTGPFYAVAKDGDGTELGYVYRVQMIDGSILIDTTVESAGSASEVTSSGTLPQVKVRVFAFDLATAAPVTGDAANITAKWSKDYGALTALTDTNPTEAEDGFYYFDLTAAERDVTIIGEIFPESSTSGVQVIGVPGYFGAGVIIDISEASLAAIVALDAVGIGSGGASEVTTTKLSAFQGETVEQIITTYLADGVTPLNLSGLTLELAFESSHGSLLAVIADADITISGASNNIVTFFYPAEVTRTVGTKIWSLRDAADRSKVRLNGTLLVSNAAFNTQ